MIRAIPIAVVLATASVQAQQSRPTNIVLIMADDVGVEAFGCYGGTSYQTPHIDRLAAKGMRFTQCHSQPLCTPTRVKLLTGQSNARNYRAFSVLRPGETTLAQLLKTAGYRTAVVGKWQLLAAQHYREDIRGSGVRPEDVGFDEWCLWQIDKLGSRYWGPRYEVNGKLKEDAKAVFGPDRYTDYLLRFIETSAKSEQPFLAYYPMALVHSPFVPTPDSPNPGAKNGPRHFGPMVGYMDMLVGRITAKLEQLGIAENTLLLFTGDNGTHKRITSKMGERTVVGGKGKTTNAGTHVPLVAYWPGTIKAGSVCEDLVDFSDFLPTFVELARLRTEHRVDGRSFLPQLRGAVGKPREAIYCWYHPRPWTRKKSKPVRFARDARFKLYGDGRLFDLDTDPDERRVVAAASANQDVAGARQKLQRVLDTMPVRSGTGYQLRGRLIDAKTRKVLSRRTFHLHFFCDEQKFKKSLKPASTDSYAVAVPAAKVRVRAYDASRRYLLFERTITIRSGQTLFDIPVEPSGYIMLRGKLLARATGKPVASRGGLGGSVLLTFHHQGRPCHAGHISTTETGAFRLRVPRGVIDISVVNTALRLERRQVDLRQVKGESFELGLWLK